METTLAGSTVMAATSGQLLLDTDDAESAVAWLAVAKIATLEIWVDGNSGSDACKALDMANETEIDGRSIALATIPRGKLFQNININCGSLRCRGIIASKISRKTMYAILSTRGCRRCRALLIVCFVENDCLLRL